MSLWLVIVLGSKSAIAAVLLTAGLVKFWNLGGFLEVVRNFSLLPKFAVKPFSTILPALEVITGLGLLSSAVVDSSIGAWAGLPAVFLFLMFVSAISLNLLRGKINISCGCYGKTSRKLRWGLVGRGLLFTVVSTLTLPIFTPGLRPSGDAVTRLSAVLIGVAFVSIAWLGNFIVGGSKFKSQSS